MQKIFDTRMIVVIVVTILSIYLTIPTFRYFYHVSVMGSNPTQEQIDFRNNLIRNSNVITLGLDLQGGADFLLEVDTDSLIRRSLTNDADGLLARLVNVSDVDAEIEMRLDDASGPHFVVILNDPADIEFAVEDVNDFLRLGDRFLRADGDVRAGLMGNGLSIRMTEQGINRITVDSVDAALQVIRRRVDTFGLTQPFVTRAGLNRIRVQVPGETDPTRLAETLLRTARLEFRLLHPNHDTAILDFIEGGRAGVVANGTGRIRRDLIEEIPNPDRPDEPIIRIVDNIPGIPAGFTLRLGHEIVRDVRTGVIDRERSLYDLVFLVRNEVPVEGSDLRSASAQTNFQSMSSPIVVGMEFNTRGADAFAEITTNHQGERFAIILDDIVFSSPNIRVPILNGRAIIEGTFTQQEATDLANVLRAGALPAPLRPIETNAIGASLGADSIRDSAIALMVGGFLLIGLMITIYGTCGIISVFTMTLNILLILAILSLMGATLTLSGIGGILLTMGMAVDANILIYERLREELASGKPLRAAINAAFGRAFSVIIDSNTTSILPALVLVLFEVVDGSMKGFWTALAIGLIANLYTGIVVTRALVEAVYNAKKSISVGKITILKKARIPWMSFRKIGFGFSAGLTILCMGYIIVEGPSYGVDFTGGVLTTVSVENTTSADRDLMLGALSSEFRDTRIIRVLNKDQWQITVPQYDDPETEMPIELAVLETQIASILNTTMGDRITIESSQTVSSLVGDEFRVIAIASLIITSLVILTYLAFRFQWIFGVGAVLALVHDVFLSLGLFKLLGFSMTLDTVSALLIILGYSVNDTIVVFDRIREKMQEMRSAKIADIINQAINETLNRTILTSGSTFLAILSLYIFGGTGLKDFALILLFGIAFGTYSSIFMASTVVYLYLNKKGRHDIIPAKKAKAQVALPKEKPVAGA